MTSITQFNNSGCEKIDPLEVNAYFKLQINPENSNLLELDSSWGTTSVDLAPLIKANETITHLFITPDGSLQYNRENYGQTGVADGGVDCISGQALSQIVSMRYLKDVDQNASQSDGMVYMYSQNTGHMEPYNLKNFVDTTNTTLSNLTGGESSTAGVIASLQTTVANLSAQIAALHQQVASLQTDLTALQAQVDGLEDVSTRVSTLETTLTKPTGIPTNAVVVWGNINAIADYTNTNLTTSGLYTHNPSTWQTNDTYDA